MSLRFLGLWLSVLVVAYALPAGAVSLSCRQIFARLFEPDVFSRQRSFRQAVKVVLNERLATKATIPPLTENTGNLARFEGNDAFQVSHRSLPVIETWGTIENPVNVQDSSASQMVMAKFDDGTSHSLPKKDPEFIGQLLYPGKKIVSFSPMPLKFATVLKLETPNGVRYFRPVDMEAERGIAKNRLTLAASRLNQALKLDTVPVSVWGSVNGRLGTLSHEAPGVEPTQSISKLLANGGIDARAFSDAQAFEFLVGNTDVHSGNVRLEANGRVRVFDHDFAFVHGLVNVKTDLFTGDETQLGALLPKKYTPEFVENLKSLSAQTIRKELEPFLSTDEIESILLRRDILLKDIELRGPSAVF